MIDPDHYLQVVKVPTDGGLCPRAGQPRLTLERCVVILGNNTRLINCDFHSCDLIDETGSRGEAADIHGNPKPDDHMFSLDTEARDLLVSEAVALGAIHYPAEIGRADR